MDNIDKEYNSNPRNPKVIIGIVLMVVGLVILVQKFNFFFFPEWLFSWPMLIIIGGLYIGAKHSFRKTTWFVMVVVGLVFLVDEIFPGSGFSGNCWPIIIVAFGINMIISRNQRWDKNSFSFRIKDLKNDIKGGRYSGYSNIPPDADLKDTTSENTRSATPPPFGFSGDKTYLGDDYLDVTSIFSGVKRKVLSKNFKGGDIAVLFGGADIDFTMADINGRVVVEITQIFGGIKMVVPPHWHVTSDVVSLFAGFDDKRINKTDYGSDKILVLRGTSFFAGVEIRSF